jgi:hypothetical protein
MSARGGRCATPPKATMDAVRRRARRVAPVPPCPDVPRTGGPRGAKYIIGAPAACVLSPTATLHAYTARAL